MALTDEQLRAFIPRTNFLVDKSYLPTVGEDETEVTTSYGIPNTNAFTGGGGSHYYPGSTSSLVSNFNKDIQAYNERIKEGNRPLREAQFPAFPQAKTPGGLPANAMYNMATKDINNAFNRSPKGAGMSSTFPTHTAKEVQDYANEALLSHQEKARTGQFGPSYIEAEKPTWSRRISDFAYDYIPGINRPQSYEDIMTSGYIQPRGMIPGIMGIMSNFGLKNYASLPQADQAFIASKRGYKGPTIFGENTTGTNKDPFGINVDSMFGNYAEYSKKESARLDKQIEKSQKNYIDKYGSLDDENEYGKSWYEMNKLNLARQGFYKNNVKDFQNITSDLSLIDKARAYEIQQAQGRIDRDETDINKATERGQAINKNEGVGSVNPTSAYGKSQGYTGGSANPHTQSGWSGSSKKKAKGGLIRSYFDGGLVSLRRR